MWFSFWSVFNFESDWCTVVISFSQPATSTSNAFPETKVFTPSCSYAVHEDVFFFALKFRPKPFCVSGLCCSWFHFFWREAYHRDRTCIFLPVRWLCCSTIHCTRDFKALPHQACLCFLFSACQNSTPASLLFYRGWKKNLRTAETSNLCIPAKRREMALRLQCNFRLWKWNWLHGGRKGGGKMEKKKNCYWNIFSLTLLALIASLSFGMIAFKGKYMFNVEIVKT